MSTTKTRRGRPKGTGIDDLAPLLQIAALMADNPDLKPTTAIRRLGITEPSVIRRLRDKFKVFCVEQLARNGHRAAQARLDPGIAANNPLQRDRSCPMQSAEMEVISARHARDKSSIPPVRRFAHETQKSALAIHA